MSTSEADNVAAKMSLDLHLEYNELACSFSFLLVWLVLEVGTLYRFFQYFLPYSFLYAFFPMGFFCI